MLSVHLLGESGLSAPAGHSVQDRTRTKCGLTRKEASGIVLGMGCSLGTKLWFMEKT